MSGRRVSTIAALVAMTLLAVGAVASNDRVYTTQHSGPFALSRLRDFPPVVQHVARKLVRIRSDATPALLVLTVGLGALAIRRGRPTSRRSWPGRGRAALLAANVALAWGLTTYVVQQATTTGWSASFPNYDQFQYHAVQDLSQAPPPWIVGAWSALAYAGHWRRRKAGPAPDVPERLGRVVGWAWLVEMVGSWLEHAFG